MSIYRVFTEFERFNAPAPGRMGAALEVLWVWSWVCVLVKGKEKRFFSCECSGGEGGRSLDLKGLRELRGSEMGRESLLRVMVRVEVYLVVQ